MLLARNAPKWHEWKVSAMVSRRQLTADLFEYENGEIFLAAAKERPFTAAFLDIYMNGADGMETARALRQTDTDCLLIFTTTSTDHALEGFQVRALHYLVKSYTEGEISSLIDEILSRIPDSGKYLDIKVNGSSFSRAMNAVLIQHLHLAETSPWFRIQAGIFYNLVCLLFALAPWYPASHAARTLVMDENFAQTWYIFWILPLIFIGLNLFMVPKYSNTLYTGRVLQGYFVISLCFC